MSPSQAVLKKSHLASKGDKASKLPQKSRVNTAALKEKLKKNQEKKLILEKEREQSKGSGSEEDEEEKDNEDKENQEDEEAEKEITSFKQFGLHEDILDALNDLNFDKPTPIQAKSLPHSLKGRDIIGIAQTGSGKTAAFALPILQALWDNPQSYFALVLAPTRELVYQIQSTFNALGKEMGLKTIALIGGMDMTEQLRGLQMSPHVLIATPGRLLDHLKTSKSFSLRKIKFLVMDEADRLLDAEFQSSMDQILPQIPRERNTYLFSATLTSKVEKLQRASLINPVKVAVNNKNDTVDTLDQKMTFISDGYKDTTLIYLLTEYQGKSVIIFTRTCAHCQRTSLLARILGFSAIPLHGQLSQSQRLGALNKFKSGERQILVATDVAARGLDIPSVDFVINYDIPTDSKSYIHRVGRTARAGRSGLSISLVTQYDIENYVRIEKVLGKKLEKYTPDRDGIEALHDSVDRASAQAITKVKEIHNNRKEKLGYGKGQGKGKGNRN